MTGIDTNILARFFTQDDPAQSGRVDEFLQSLTLDEPGFVSLVVLAELVWVLRGYYGATKAQIIESVKSLLTTPEIVVEAETAVVQALARYTSNTADFADCMIERCGHIAGCS
ncbi:MAG: type II toxin-antitoxin system VapC family toxin [Terracidiphilus sp.]